MLNISRKANGVISTNNPISVLEYNLLVQSLKALVGMSGNKLGDTSTDQIMKASDMFVKYTLYKDNGIENNIVFTKEEPTLPVDYETYDNGAFMVSKVKHTNTGHVVCNIGDLDAKPLFNANGQQLTSGEIRADMQYLFLFSSELDGFVYYNIFSEDSNSQQEYAEKGGDDSIPFKAADPVDDDDAVNVDYLMNLLANKVFDNVVVKDPNINGGYNDMTLSDGKLVFAKKDSNDNIVNSMTIKVDENNANVWTRNMLVNKDEARLDSGYLVEAKRNNRLNMILDNPTSDLGLMYRETIDGNECICINLHNDGTGENQRFILNGVSDGSGDGGGSGGDGGSGGSGGSGDVNAPDNYINLENVKNVILGDINVFIVDEHDVLWCGGLNDVGQLGLGHKSNVNRLNKTNMLVKEVFTISSRTYVITTDNELFVSGFSIGALNGNGDNVTNFVSTGMIVKDISISRGMNKHICIINEDNELWVTGYNAYGQLGINNTDLQYSFVNTGIIAKKIYCGHESTFVIKDNDELWACGNEHVTGTNTGASEARLKVFTNTNITAKEVVSYYSTLVKDIDDKLWVTGGNGDGQLGLGDTDGRNVFIDTGYIIKDFYLFDNNGNAFSYLITNTNNVYVTGKNDHGQLGLGDTNIRNSWTDNSIVADVIVKPCTPIQILNVYLQKNDGSILKNDTSDDTFSDTGLVAKNIIYNNNNTYILTTEGALYSSGINHYGELGFGDTDVKNDLTQVDVDIDEIYGCSDKMSIIKTTNGRIKTCGYNLYGQSIDGSFINKTSYHDITTFVVDNIKSIDMIYHNYSTYIINNDNELMVCGKNNSGKLGINEDTDQVLFINSNIKIKSIYTCASETFLITDDDRLYATGANGTGQLGIGDTDDRKVFTDTGLNGVNSVIGGSDNGIFALMQNGELYAAGANSKGQLGVGDTEKRLTFTNTFSNVKKVMKMFRSSFIIDINDKLWVTGDNAGGQLGLGDDNPRDSWVDTGKLVKDIVMQSNSTYIIDMDDKVWATGLNDEGQLGISDISNVNVFTDTGMYAKKIIANDDFCFIIDLDSKLYATGYNTYGQLGVGDVDTVTSFTDTGMIVKQVSSEIMDTYVLDMNNNVLHAGSSGTEKVFTDSGLQAYKIVSYFKAGYPFSIFVDLNNWVWSVGHGDDGQTALGGSGSTTFPTKTNKQAKAIYDVGSDAKEDHADINVILTIDDKLYVAGNNDNGQLGVGDTTDRTNYSYVDFIPRLK